MNCSCKFRFKSSSMPHPSAPMTTVRLFGAYSSQTALCKQIIYIKKVMYRFIMKQYSHNAKLCVYAIAVVYNLVSASSTVAQNHLSLLAGHVDMLNLIFSKGLPEDKGM